MAKAIAIEEKLASMAAIDTRSPSAAEQLRCALKDKSNLVVARAANLAAKGDLKLLSDDLEAAFNRLMAGGMSADRGCTAKQALAHALYQFGTGSVDLFLAGIHHVQMEPVFGGHSDTAAQLRGSCALGLVRIGHRHALAELADLLGDSEQQARIMAARALAYTGSEYAALPLRVKVRCGDASPEVTGECFTALLQLTPDEAIPLIGRFLDSKDLDVWNEAAVALASCRKEKASQLLLDCWERNPLPDVRERLMSPLAMTRRPEAIGLLVTAVEHAPTPLACSAIESLGMYRSDAAIRAHVLAAAGERDSQVKAAAAKSFPA